MRLQLKIAESVEYSFSRSFSSDNHREKTSEWRKAIMYVDINLKLPAPYYL